MKILNGRKTDNLFGWMLLMPLIVLLSIFYVFPVLHNIWLSMTDYSGLKLQDYSFVGLQNYREIFEEGFRGLTGMVVWTVLFAACVVTLSLLLGSMIAVMLENTGITISKVYRGIFILPWIIPAVITLLMWRGLLNTEQGLINEILAFFGLGRVPWLTDPVMAKISAILVMTWFSFPYFIIVVQGILKSIPRDYYEASYILGANAFQSFRHITMPMVIKAILPTLIMAFIMQFNQFGMYILTLGEPAADTLGAPGATDLLLTYVFNTAFKTFRYDLAAAYSVIIFIFVAAFSLVGMRLGKKIGNVEQRHQSPTS